MIQFFAPDIAETLELPEKESGHAVRVLRMQRGDMIYVTDGKGTRYQCEIVNPHPKRVELCITDCQKIENHWGAPITLCVAPTKNSDRIEWMIEKAVEIGVDKIILFASERSERRKFNLERLQRIAESAMNQSLKTYLPIIEGILPLKQIIESKTEGISKFIAYCADDVARHEFACCCPVNKATMILIGPEGDFTPDEAKLAINCGFMPISFGQSRLRTETAALFGLQTIHILRQADRCKVE